MTNTFYRDRSKWQGVIGVNDFQAVEAYRVDTGYQTDEDWTATFHNAAEAHAAGRLHLLIAYVVHIPGHEEAIADRVKGAVGAVCPPWVRFMVDEESGAGFAGPGDHSAGANHLTLLLGAYTGVGVMGVCGYANGSDWQSNWASRVGGLKRIVARYSSQPPSGSWYGWQYWGGVPNSVPSGYPRAIGTDWNVIPRPVSQILTDFGVTQKEADQMQPSDVVNVKIVNPATKVSMTLGARLLDTEVRAQRMQVQLDALSGKLDRLLAKLGA